MTDHQSGLKYNLQNPHIFLPLNKYVRSTTGGALSRLPEPETGAFLKLPEPRLTLTLLQRIHSRFQQIHTRDTRYRRLRGHMVTWSHGHMVTWYPGTCLLLLVNKFYTDL